jgi:hypothetical protein
MRSIRLKVLLCGLAIVLFNIQYDLLKSSELHATVERF